MSGHAADLAVRARRLRPEPARFWLARAPTAWSFDAVPWTDLAAARVGRPIDPSRVGPWPPAEVDDLTYLPPGAVLPQRTSDGCLLQLLPGEPVPSGSAWVVWDLLAPLLARDLDTFETLGGGSAVWPLLPGLTTASELWDEALPRLAAGGVRHVQPLVLETDPTDKRRLAELGDDGVFAALFHGAAPSERAFSRRAARWGLRPFARRPAVPGTARRRGNRRLAGELLLAGELWLRCGRGEAEGHALLRAGRWIEGTDHDVAALAREGNLEVVPWLDASSRRAVAEAAETGASALVARLEAEYVREEGE